MSSSAWQRRPEHTYNSGVSNIFEERRSGAERRHRFLRTVWSGHVERRRVAARRTTDRHPIASDSHHPQWFAAAVLILLLCAADALLTLALVNRGAAELNPIMRAVLQGSAREFTLWKIGLTSIGVLVLVVLARTRAFGRWRVGPLLYAVLIAYGLLVGYELRLLDPDRGMNWSALFEADGD